MTSQYIFCEWLKTLDKNIPEKDDSKYYPKAYRAFSEYIKKSSSLHDLTKRLSFWLSYKYYPNTCIFNQILKHLVRFGELELTKRLFDLFYRKNMVNTVTFNTLIDAYGKRGDLKSMEFVYQEALKRGMVNMVTFHIMIQYYFTANMIQECKDICDSIRKDNKIDNKTLDFHNYNEISSYLIVKYLIENKENVNTITTGKGLHSKNNKTPVRTGVIEALEELKIKYIYNNGIIIINQSQ